MAVVLVIVLGIGELKEGSMMESVLKVFVPFLFSTAVYFWIIRHVSTKAVYSILAGAAVWLDRCRNGHVTGMDYSEVSVAESQKLNALAIKQGKCNVVQGDVYCGTDQGHRRCGLCFGCSFWKFQKYRGICDHACRVGSGDKGGFGNWCFGTGDSANICL